MDARKKTIADHVHKHVMGHTQELTEALGLPDASDIEIQRVDDLNTQIRMRTPGQGIRYFTVQLKEHW